MARAEKSRDDSIRRCIFSRSCYWLLENLDELKNLNTAGKLFVPTMEKEEREKLYKGWKRAVRANTDFADG